jgi:hypothetical protein
MHQGISKKLKPKVKSEIAVNQLYPKLVGMLPRRLRGGMHDGFIDALLIAGYGLRSLGRTLQVSVQRLVTSQDDEIGDFF